MVRVHALKDFILLTTSVCSVQPIAKFVPPIPPAFNVIPDILKLMECVPILNTLLMQLGYSTRPIRILKPVRVGSQAYLGILYYQPQVTSI